MLLLGPFCVLQIMAGDRTFLRLVHYVPRTIVFGLLVWYAALVSSFGVNFESDDLIVIQSYTMKIALGVLFVVAVAEETTLRNSSRLFALSAFFATIATFYVYRTQGSGAIRSASFVNVDFGSVSLLEGLARAGAVGSIPLMAAWLEAVFAKKLLHRLAWYGAMFALFVAAMLALRREYLLSISLCLLWGVATLPLGFRKVNAIFVVIVLLVVGFGTLQAIPEWRLRLFDETIDTFVQRQDPRALMLINAPQFAMESPLVGFGLGSYPMLMAQRLPIALITQEEVTRFYYSGLASHNSLLTALVETGIFGFLGLVVFFSSVGIWSLRVWRVNRASSGNPLALFAPIFAIQLFFGTMFQDGLVNNTIWTFFGMLVAIIASERAKMHGAAPPAGRPRQRNHHVRHPRTA
jgi:hypothetical protein